jgi:hypothetical protein
MTLLLRAIGVAAVAVALFLLHTEKTELARLDVRSGYEREANERQPLSEWYTKGVWMILVLGVIGLAAAGVTARAPHNNERCPRCAKPTKEKTPKCRLCGFDFQSGNLLLEDTKGCPGCGMLLLKEAVRCRHCGHDFRRGRTAVA